MKYNSDLLDGIAIFTSVVENQGFSAAARQLRHTTSHISKVIATLEERLGVRLLNRTTRSVSLTDAGRAFYEKTRLITDLASEATEEAMEGQSEPSGKLRITAPVSFGLSQLAQYLPDFIRRYPNIKTEIELSDRFVDIVGESFDIAIRIGQLPDSSLVAKKLGEARGVVVASPTYWNIHGRPAHPQDLADHQCISFSNMTDPRVWRFVETSGQVIKVNIDTVSICNSAELETALAVAGLGVTRLPMFACEAEVIAGKLEIVLEDFEADQLSIHAVYAHRGYLPAKVRVFIDYSYDVLNGKISTSKPKNSDKPDAQ